MTGVSDRTLKRIEITNENITLKNTEKIKS